MHKIMYSQTWFSQSGNLMLVDFFLKANVFGKYKNEIEENKEMLTSSTQTECLEDHGLQLMKTHEYVRNQQNSYQSYVDNTDNLYWNSCDMYYSTQYSDCYQMYSTLV